MLTKLAKSFFTLTLIGLALGQFGCNKANGASSEASKTEAPAGVPLPPPVKAGEARKVSITITEKGYEPPRVALRKGEPVELVVTRVTDATCATELILEEAGLDLKLPLNEAVTARFTPEKTGELRYGCAMGKMIAGVFAVQE